MLRRRDSLPDNKAYCGQNISQVKGLCESSTLYSVSSLIAYLAGHQGLIRQILHYAIYCLVITAAVMYTLLFLLTVVEAILLGSCLDGPRPFVDI